MKILPALLAVLALVPAATIADDQPAAGKFLVATAEVDGSSFERTVILLLHHDEAGAQGLVINRRSDAELAEVFQGSAALADYKGALFWGGPVRMATMRALLRIDEPPPDAVKLVANVYQVPLDGELDAYLTDESTLRFYVGYAGWAPGQLDRNYGSVAGTSLQPMPTWSLPPTRLQSGNEFARFRRFGLCTMRQVTGGRKRCCR